jgi:starch synthase
MDPQKGVDIALSGLRLAAELPWQAVLLGTGIQYLEEEAAQLARDFPERVRAVARYDDALSRQIYAGADVLLMPSRYEPCGLAQMIAMRYGCVPLVRETGGLGDTVHPYTDQLNGTGFLFTEPSPHAFANTLGEALAPMETGNAGSAQLVAWERFLWARCPRLGNPLSQAGALTSRAHDPAPYRSHLKTRAIIPG